MTNYAVNDEGYLLDPLHWENAFAEKIALQWQRPFTEDHLQIILHLRQFYFEFNTLPALRVLINYLKKSGVTIGDTEINSAKLQSLFPDPFMRHACKIAGLPKPVKCM